MISLNKLILANRKHLLSIKKNQPTVLANIYMRQASDLIIDANVHMESAINTLLKNYNTSQNIAFAEKTIAKAEKKIKLFEKYKEMTLNIYKKKERIPDKELLRTVESIKLAQKDYQSLKKTMQPTLEFFLGVCVKLNEELSSKQIIMMQNKINPLNIN